MYKKSYKYLNSKRDYGIIWGMDGKVRMDAFSVKNQRSFYKEQKINFNSDVMAFYGANASGKTNLHKAMLVAVLYIEQSINPDSRGVPHYPFLLLEGANEEPSVYSFWFHDAERKYEYSFAAKGGKIVSETMKDLTSSRPRLIFDRENAHGSDTAARNGFPKKMFRGPEAVRDDSLIITLAQQTKNPYANALFGAIHNLALFDLNGRDGLRDIATDILQRDPEIHKKVLRLLKRADFPIMSFSVNISKITRDMLTGAPILEEVKEQLVKTGRNISVATTRTVRNQDGDRVGTVIFDMERQESLGTYIFFYLAVIMIDAIENGKIVFIDEFGSSLHTDLCQFVIKFFKREGRKTGAKLVFNTHDAGLIRNGNLGVLEKDEIMIVEKDRLEETIITPLKDKMKRADENVGKKYALGMYGGVPILEEIDE